MIGLMLLEIISIASFLFSGFMLFISFAPISHMYLIFIWTVFSTTIFAINSENSAIYQASTLLLFAPLIFYHDITGIFFILTISVILIVYVKKSILRINHNVYVNKLQITLVIYLVLFYVSSIIESVEGAFSISSPFMIIYLISSIMLSRTIRHLDSNMELRKIRRINIRYLITVFLVFSVAAFENVKSFIFTTVDKLIDILFYPLFLLSKILKILFDKIRIEEDIKKTEEVLEEVLENNQIEEMGEFLGEQSNGFDFTIIINIIMFLLVVAAIYAIYKVIVKTGAKQYKTAEFIEEREYIKNPKRKRKLFKRDKLPSELKGQIRYYYRKYLEKLIRENIDIRKSDTTLDIQTKAEEVYLDINEKIRQIYIESRYGQKKVDREKVEEMKELYKSFRP